MTRDPWYGLIHRQRGFFADRVKRIYPSSDSAQLGLLASRLEASGIACEVRSESQVIPGIPFGPKDSLGRGINSVQLWSDSRRWWVVNLLWDDERPGNPIPPAYKPR